MIKSVLTLILLVTFSFCGISQKNYNSAKEERIAYQKMKKEGNIPADFKFTYPLDFSQRIGDNFRKNGFKSKKKSDECGCYITPDANYAQALPPNDDESSNQIAIPFDFCLYGTNYNAVYINTNGNVSFGTEYGEYSAEGFPSQDFVMVAPFWADVDTRGIGDIKYRITATAMYVNWENVGYYDTEDDLTNTFQLIITNGNDPILPSGNNVSFCYKDMQWTTGASSDGIDGFRGIPATVGVNKGNNIDFFQLGRFDRDNNRYDGPGNFNDGIDWLDNQSFYLNVCSETNISPIATFYPIISTNALGNCDTIKICGANDTIIIDGLFISPEVGEITTTTINFNGSLGFTRLNNTSGNPAKTSVQFIANATNAGLNTITFTATDDGTPSRTTTIDYLLFVDTTISADLKPEILGDTEFCESDNTSLRIASGDFDSFIWSNGSNDSSITVRTPGDYSLTAGLNGCYKTVSVDVTTLNSTTTITGDTVICEGQENSVLSLDLGFYSYLWNTSVNDTLNTISVTAPGVYSVKFTDSIGCSGNRNITVISQEPENTINGIISFCIGDSITLYSDPGYTSYLWNSGEVTESISAGDGEYSLTVTDIEGCTDRDTVILVGNPNPTASFTRSPSGNNIANQPIVFTDNSLGNITSWVWDFDKTSITGALPSDAQTQGPHTVNFTNSGVYKISLSVNSDNGCGDSTIQEFSAVTNIIAPNVITPNGDIYNQFLVFENLEYQKSGNLMIFNRWGTKIYEQENYQNDWNGEKNSEGTYYYILTVDGIEEKIKGSFSLLK